MIADNEFRVGDLIEIIEDAQFLYTVPVSRSLEITKIEGKRIWAKSPNSRGTDTLYGEFEVLIKTLRPARDTN